jgi:hypothetical protein
MTQQGISDRQSGDDRPSRRLREIRSSWTTNPAAVVAMKPPIAIRTARRACYNSVRALGVVERKTPPRAEAHG